MQRKTMFSHITLEESRKDNLRRKNEKVGVRSEKEKKFSLEEVRDVNIDYSIPSSLERNSHLKWTLFSSFTHFSHRKNFCSQSQLIPLSPALSFPRGFRVVVFLKFISDVFLLISPPYTLIVLQNLYCNSRR